jgi:hypothetical protein
VYPSSISSVLIINAFATIILLTKLHVLEGLVNREGRKEFGVLVTDYCSTMLVITFVQVIYSYPAVNTTQELMSSWVDCHTVNRLSNLWWLHRLKYHDHCHKTKNVFLIFIKSNFVFCYLTPNNNQRTKFQKNLFMFWTKNILVVAILGIRFRTSFNCVTCSYIHGEQQNFLFISNLNPCCPDWIFNLDNRNPCTK